MLNNCDIRDTMARYKLFDRTGNVHSHHQQASEKGDEQTVKIDADASVPSTKKWLERITNQFAWEQTSEKLRVRFDKNYYNVQWHQIQSIWKYEHDQKY